MDSLLDALTRRENVVALAVTGAVLATVGSYCRVRGGGSRRRWPRTLVHVGYGFTALSVLLFVIAGFRS